MSSYFDVYPDHPQQRSLHQLAEIVRGGGVIAYPTDSGYALGCALSNRDGLDRIRTIRQLKETHHFTLMIRQFVDLGQYVELGNAQFRTIKALTPGPYTFILKATRELPRVMVHPKKKTVGVRIPDHHSALELLSVYGEPLVSTTLILPGEDDPRIDGWSVKDDLDHVIDAVLDSGDAGHQPSTVIDWTTDIPEIVRVGGGDTALFED
ncbi:MAG: L-threonylcarbamoyladenylate synthase [Propionibacteriaceae bacterium]